MLRLIKRALPVTAKAGAYLLASAAFIGALLLLPMSGGETGTLIFSIGLLLAAAAGFVATAYWYLGPEN